MNETFDRSRFYHTEKEFFYLLIETGENMRLIYKYAHFYIQDDRNCFYVVLCVYVEKKYTE